MANRRAFLAALPLAAAALPAARARAAGIPLRVGAVPNDPYAQAYYAQDRGFFADAGLDVTLTTMPNGAAIAAGVASGALDVGVSNPIGLATATLHGLSFVYFAGGGLYTSNDALPVLCVANSSPVTDVKQLENATIAVNALHDIGEVGIKAYFAQHGATVDKLAFVELRFSEMGVALQRGTVAAGLLSEPALTAAQDAGTVRIIADVYDAIAKRFFISGWFSTGAWYNANRDLAQRFTKAMYATARWANTHHADSADILSRYSQVSPQTTHRMRRCQYAESLDPAWLQPSLDVGARYGITTQRVLASTIMAPA